jgi:predicted flap endonuclease-1-like 5' DNA nuclease
MVTDAVGDDNDLAALEDEAVEGAINTLEAETGRKIEDVEVTLYSGMTEDETTGETYAAVVAIATAVGAPDEAAATRGPSLMLGTPPREPHSKDLQLVEGIGPRIAALLVEHNIYDLADLAATPVERLREILAGGGARFRLAEPATWPEQAALGAAGDWAGLTQLQARLKGGRA